MIGDHVDVSALTDLFRERNMIRIQTISECEICGAIKQEMRRYSIVTLSAADHVIPAGQVIDAFDKAKKNEDKITQKFFKDEENIPTADLRRRGVVRTKSLLDEVFGEHTVTRPCTPQHDGESLRVNRVCCPNDTKHFVTKKVY